MTNIHESDYGDANFHIGRRDDTLSVEITYPELGGVKHIEVDQESVRASDGIRLTFDYDRDGWSIQQPRLHNVLIEETETCRSYDSYTEWVETAFVESWAFEEVEDLSPTPPA